MRVLPFLFVFLSSLSLLQAADPPDAVNISKAREQGRKQLFEWSAWSDEAFARAKREHRFVLLDCAAEWCHWCHVMDETTYADPEIGKILNDRFVAIRVDIDNRPDLAERYGAWGWPATVIFSADAEELGKFRGYLSPEEFKPILANINEASARTDHVAPEPSAPVDALGWLGAQLTMMMDDWYDPAEGGWGRRQKAPLGANAEFELRRAAHGDTNALKRAIFSLEKQAALIDPVWGGICQYSAASNWNEPHFEKLMTDQAINLEAYARGGQKRAEFIKSAYLIDGYIDHFLTSSNGTFFTTQDADLNAHEKDKPFVDGHTYYALDDGARRKLGIPRIDTSVYARENGLAIAALATLYEVTQDKSVLERARRAADAVLASHVLPDGSVAHDEHRRTGPFYLADAAALGWGIARLAEISGNPEYKKRALEIGWATVKNFLDAESGGLWERTVDPNAVGVFTHRQQPFVHNVVAARFFAALSRIPKGVEWRDRSQKVLAAIATPRKLNEQGRMLGEYLLALDESGAYLW